MPFCSIDFTRISYVHSSFIPSVKGYITWCHIPKDNSLTVATIRTINITHFIRHSIQSLFVLGTNHAKRTSNMMVLPEPYILLLRKLIKCSQSCITSHRYICHYIRQQYHQYTRNHCDHSHSAELFPTSLICIAIRDFMHSHNLTAVPLTSDFEWGGGGTCLHVFDSHSKEVQDWAAP